MFLALCISMGMLGVMVMIFFNIIEGIVGLITGKYKWPSRKNSRGIRKRK